MSEVSAETVRMAYRLFLNREVESNEVVTEMVSSYPTYRELREAFLSSAEFQSNVPISREIGAAYFGRPAAVDVVVSGHTMETLLNRVREQWRELGETNPYWSVLTDESFLVKNIDSKRLEVFYESGKGSERLIELFQERTGVAAQRGTCLELGCGVGRETLHLAKAFDRVIAADISPGNLALCKLLMKNKGINNVETVLVGSPEELSKLGGFDFFYSVIVLQHNPPPVQKLLLDNILGQIRPGGACLFQTPSTLPNYSFSAEKYLSSDKQIMDMHCLPKPIVLKLIYDHGLEIRDLQLDNWTGSFGSYTYFATKAKDK